MDGEPWWKAKKFAIFSCHIRQKMPWCCHPLQIGHAVCQKPAIAIRHSRSLTTLKWSKSNYSWKQSGYILQEHTKSGYNLQEHTKESDT